MNVPTRRMLAAAALLVAVSAVGAMAGDDWSHDWSAAKAQAAAEKKDILIDFNGSDWCGWCIRLTREVFSKEAFKGEGPKHFVLFEVDFVRNPENVEKQDKKVRAQNLRLIGEFKVPSYPSIFLADEKGRPYARTGYKKGGPEPYLEHLMELKKIRAKRDDMFAKAAAAEGMDKAKLYYEALKALKMPEIPFYTSVVNEILAADPDDTLGVKQKYLDQIFAFELNSVYVAQQSPGADFAGLLKKLDGLAKVAGTKGEKAQRLFQIRAIVEFTQTNPADLEKRDFSVLLRGFQKAVEADPGSDLANGAKGLKVQIEKIKKRLAKDK